MAEKKALADEIKLMDEKRVSGAPCATVEYSKTKKSYVWTYPAVECELVCETCGWNPEVREERLKKLRREKGWRRTAV